MEIHADQMTRPGDGRPYGGYDPQFMDTPELPPGTEASLAQDAVRATSGPGPCEALTATAIQHLIDRIAQAGNQADANVVANGPDAPGAGAPDAATVSAQNVRNGQERLTRLVKWLEEKHVFGASGVLVNPVGGYAIYNRLREAILDLHYARHFAAVSAAWNSKRDPSGALGCITSVTAVVDDLEELSSQATRCYLSLWYPEM